MVARPNETLEEHVECFQYNLQRSPYASLPLPDNVLKTSLIILANMTFDSAICDDLFMIIL